MARGIPAGPKPPVVHSFGSRPVTPPGSDVAESPGGKTGKKEKRLSKFKRFSGLGKSKA